MVWIIWPALRSRTPARSLLLTTIEGSSFTLSLLEKRRRVCYTPSLGGLIILQVPRSLQAGLSMGVICYLVRLVSIPSPVAMYSDLAGSICLVGVTGPAYRTICRFRRNISYITPFFHPTTTGFSLPGPIPHSRGLAIYS